VQVHVVHCGNYVARVLFLGGHDDGSVSHVTAGENIDALLLPGAFRCTGNQYLCVTGKMGGWREGWSNHIPTTNPQRESLLSHLQTLTIFILQLSITVCCSALGA
jgi:hypothetical protein